MCGGPSGVVVRVLNLPADVENRLIGHGLGTAQAIIDEGRQGLSTIGLSEIDIAGIAEAIHQETDEWLE
jgi:hypothetical protein